MKYIFWSIYIASTPYEVGHWLCIPPYKKYLPEDYPEKAIRKHEEELLPPPSYWLKPEYENIAYQLK